MLPIKIKLEEGAKLPVKGTEDAACWDCYAHRISHLDNGKIEVSLGFSTEIPKGWKGIIVPRSNLTKYYYQFNHGFGVVDSDYRNLWKAIFTPILRKTEHFEAGDLSSQGELYGLKVTNHVIEPFPYLVGDRCCQLFFERVNDINWLSVTELEESNRTGGFGSTGNK